MRQCLVVQIDCLISIELRQWVDGGVIKECTTGLTVTVLTIAVQFVMTGDKFYIYCVITVTQIACLLHRLVCMSCKRVRASHSAVV
jgi:hypothetical protein